MADRWNSLKCIYETGKALSGAFQEEIIIELNDQGFSAKLMIYQGFKGNSARGQQYCQPLQTSKINLVLCKYSQLLFKEMANIDWGNRPIASIGPIRILGIEVDLAWSGGSCGGIFSYVNVFPHKSLHFMLDPVQYREYEYGLFVFHIW